MAIAERISYAPDAGGVAAVLNPGGRAAICLVCEHASAFIPPALGDLGLAAEDRLSHAAWDPGAEALTRALASRLDARALVARVSRLVHDCNRPAGAAEAMPERTERIAIPGNAGLSEAARQARAEGVHAPFHRQVAGLLDGFEVPPALITVHSFAPVWYGQPRSVEIGLLHDADDVLALRMMAAADGAPGVALNQPYSAADGVTHTLRAHALPHRLPNVMIEVRNDLLADEAGVAAVADRLAAMLAAALAVGAGPA